MTTTDYLVIGLAGAIAAVLLGCEGLATGYPWMLSITPPRG